MTKKIENTFAKALEQVETLQKVFRQNGKLESAMMESSTDISSLAAINSAFETLKQALSTSTTLTEGVLDANDDDGFMARSQLYFMARDAIQLHGIIGDTDDLEPWVQSKIAQAAQGMDAVRRYTEYNAMNDSMPMEDTPPIPKARPVKHTPGAFHDHMGDMLDSDDMKAAVARAFGPTKGKLTPDEFFKKRLGEEQIDEGKVATWALALLLGLGSYAGLEATSAKHTPLGQALEYAAEQGDKEAAKLFKNIDAYVDSDPQSLVNWRMSNEKIFDRFDESASLMEDGPNPLMRFLAPFVSGAGSDVYNQPHAGAWDSHSHDNEYADKPAEFMATRNTAADSVLKSLQKANPEKRYNIYQEILKNLTKPGGFVYEDATLMEHPLIKIIKNLMKKGDELGNKISDEDLASATATAATLGGLGAATRPRRKDAETPDEFMRKRVGEGDYGKKKKKKKKKYYESSLQDELMNDAKEMDMDDFVVHAMKHGMKQSDAYGMWDDMNPYDEDHIEPFSDDDYDEFGVRHSTSFNQPPKNESAEQKPYICVHAKKGKHECHAGSSYEAAKKAAAHWKMKSTAGIDAHLAVEEGFKIRDKSRGYGVADKTYKTREEAKKAATMKAAETGGDWEVLEEGMEFDEKRNDDLQTVAKDLFANAKAAAKKKAK